MLHSASYGNSTLYVLTIPDNFNDLYYLPAEVLTRIRKTVAKDIYVYLDAPAKIALFVYDNDTFIVHSFLDESADIGLVLDSRFTQLKDLLSDEVLSSTDKAQDDNKNRFSLTIKPHSFRVFRALE